MGLSLAYIKLDRLEEALKEINNLQVFFQLINLPEIKLSSELLHAHVLCQMEKHGQAIEVLWACFENLRVYKDLYSHLQLLYTMGSDPSQS